MKKQTVSVYLFDCLCRYAQQFDLDRESVCEAINIDISTVCNHDYRMDAQKFAKAWIFVSNQINQDHFGLNLGRNHESFPFSHITFFVMQNSENLLEALRKCIKYHNLVSDVASPSIRKQDHHIILGLDYKIPEMQNNLSYTCFIFSMVVTLLRHLSGNEICPVEISFMQKKSENIYEGLVEYFQSKIFFNARNSQIVFNYPDLMDDVILSNPALLPHLELTATHGLENLSHHEKWSQRVKNAIYEMINAKNATLDQICSQLLVSRRTLQSRLKQENTSFRKLYQDARKEKAMTLLKDLKIPIIEIAFVLGFSEQSAFHHAFKRWSGCTPNVYRKNIIENSTPE
ncbi:MAG: AraC family transcriptional regulator [Desulfobacteraceae bacterium]|nr:AraC family transcriptional regulator [Desulfobacteraceae bacterium]